MLFMHMMCNKHKKQKKKGRRKMTEAQIQARKEYKRQWRKNNPEKCKAYQLKFWTKKAEELKQADEQKKKEGDRLVW